MSNRELPLDPASPRTVDISRIDVIDDRQAECHRRMTPAQRGDIG